MRYKEWRKLYEQQAKDEGWMLHGADIDGYDYVFLHWFSTSPYSGSCPMEMKSMTFEEWLELYGEQAKALDSLRNPTALRQHVKHRAEVDKDPAAIYASQLLEAAEIAQKLCAGGGYEP